MKKFFLFFSIFLTILLKPAFTPSSSEDYNKLKIIEHNPMLKSNYFFQKIITQCSACMTTPDGKYIVVEHCDPDGCTIVIYSLINGFQIRASYSVDKKRIAPTQFACSADGALIAFKRNEHEIAIVNPFEGTMQTIHQMGNTIASFQPKMFSPFGEYLFTEQVDSCWGGTTIKTVTQWNYRSEKCSGSELFNEATILYYSSLGDYVISQLSGKKRIMPCNDKQGFNAPHILSSRDFSHISFADNLIALASDENIYFVIPKPSIEQSWAIDLKNYSQDKQRIKNISLSPNGEYIAAIIEKEIPATFSNWFCSQNVNVLKIWQIDHKQGNHALVASIGHVDNLMIKESIALDNQCIYFIQFASGGKGSIITEYYFINRIFSNSKKYDFPSKEIEKVWLSNANSIIHEA